VPDNYGYTQYLIPIVFTRQQWLRERATLLRYKYVSYPVMLNAADIHVSWNDIGVSVTCNLMFF